MTSTVAPRTAGAATGPELLIGLGRRRLFLGSALMLFLELALIRWLGANIVHLSYFSNFVLLGSFLGIGLGFLIVPATLVGACRLPRSCLARAGRRRRSWSPVTIDRSRRRAHLLHLAAAPPARRPGWCCR